MELTPGSRHGSYEIIAPLGTGGMGEVHLARDGRLDHPFICKIDLKPSNVMQSTGLTSPL